MPLPPPINRIGVTRGLYGAIDETPDYELLDTTRALGSHTNMIPLTSSVHAPRHFYGARFYNQALPMDDPEEPLVQNLDVESGRSFDSLAGEFAGARRSAQAGKVTAVDKNGIDLEYEDGSKTRVQMYHNFPFNRKTHRTDQPLVKPGDSITPGQVLTKSNFTTDSGSLALGKNARVGIVPMKGWSMDDALAVSADFATRAKVNRTLQIEHENDDSVKTGFNHFISLFPDKYEKAQVEKMDEDGIVKIGAILNPGDPIILSTSPRSATSSEAKVGKLSRVMQNLRKNSSKEWEYDDPATVLDVVKTKSGVKVITNMSSPMRVGDKGAFRTGAKFIVSKIIPTDQMPQTKDGKPLDLLLNQLSIYSRINSSLIYEILMGKLAKKNGTPIILPGFTKPGVSQRHEVERMLKEAGLESEERIYDPAEDRDLDNPIMVGDAFVMRLHHTADDKKSSRGIGSYDCFDKDTEVLTDRGWVFWPDVNEDDKLCTPNHDVSEARFEKPYKLVAYDYNGKLIQYKSRHLEWMVTPNHEFLTYGKNNKATKMPVTLLRERVRISIPQFGFTCNGVTPKYKTFDGVLKGKDGRNRQPMTIDFIDYARFMGWWVAEGSVELYRGRVFIYQQSNKDYVEEIRALFVKVFGRHPIKLTGSGWCIDEWRVSEFLEKNSGTNGYNVRIPRDIITAGKDAVDAFMEAYIKGDGSESLRKVNDGRKSLNHVRQVGSVSKGLMDDMQEMLMRVGQGMLVKLTRLAGRTMQMHPTSKEYKCADFYSGAVHLKRKKATVVPAVGMPRYTGKWDEVDYKGKVYCATTSSGLLVVRKNGKPCVTGNSNEAPMKGSGDAAQAKRQSGLENLSLLSSGGYATMREMSTVRGQKSDAFWRDYRAGHQTANPGKPFVWNKFLALLNGAGIKARDHGKGRLRLGPLTDATVDSMDTLELKNGEMVDNESLQPIKGGLFDPALVAGNKWGRISLDQAIPSPAYEDQIRSLLGLSRKQFAAVMAGQEHLS